jgi:predicted nucleotidyltransferase
MTMQIKGLQIAGLPAIAVRKMLRRVHYLLDVDLVAASCELPTRMAKQVIQELVNDGYIEFAERSRVLAYPYTPGKEKPRYRWVDYYKLTDKGDKLTQASATNKMPRTKADRIIANFMKRVEEVNANADYMFRIPTVILYGSYVRGEPHLSDVDIAVDFEAKWDRGNTSQEEFLALTNKRVTVAQANGRVFSSFDGTLDWPRREVMLHLKARTKGLSIHELYDFIGMKKDSNFAYKVLLGDAPKIAEQIAKERSLPAESKAFSES